MKFRSLSANNLFSFKNFSISLGNGGLVLVTGFSIDEGSSNGSGKSSLINKSLLWALFGQTAEGIKSDEVINRHLVGNASATLTFSIGSSLYQIDRVRTTKGLSKLEFIKDRTLISNRDVRSTQEMINYTIGRDINSFIQTDFFGQGNSFPFMKLAPAGQKEVLEKVLPFDCFNGWLANTKAAKREIGAARIAAEQEKAKALAASGALQAQRNSIRAQRDRWDAEKANSISSLTKELHKLQNSAEEVELKKVRAELDTLEGSWTFDTFDDTIYKKLDENNRLSKKIEVNKAAEKALQLEIKTLKNLTEDSVCPTCKQDVVIPEEQKTSNKISLTSLNAQIEDIKNSNNISESLLEINNTVISEYKGIKFRRDNLMGRIVELEEDNPSDKITAIETNLNTLNLSENPYTQTLEDIEKTIKDNTGLEATWVAKLATIIEEEKSVLMWEKAYAKDLRLLLYSRVCPFLSERANHHLQELNNSQITVNFSTTAQLKDDSTKEEFTATASSLTGGNAYFLLSGGEQQMVDFAVGLALADLAATQVKSRSNLLVLDEPFVGLDARNSESIVSYLQTELSKVKSTIFLISNEETLKGLIPNTVHVEKEYGISKIVP